MVLRGGDGPPAEGVKECQVVHSVYNRGVPTRVDAVLSHGHVLDGSRLVCRCWDGLDGSGSAFSSSLPLRANKRILSFHHLDVRRVMFVVTSTGKKLYKWILKQVIYFFKSF